ncbi:MAG: histidine kinase dimerization/phospho-acceptor domain-containing protein [Pseudomonadota bacterium]|nr:histidine kinase dimerization/phospho-acceptor domain-containing protein [Pseudomonadota bacterium]
MDTEQIRKQQASGFGYLRFEPALEAPYRLARAALIRQRARPVSIAGFLLFLVYAGMDLVTLPPDLARVTVSIRLAITCPVIAIVVWLAYRPTPSDRVFEHIYLAAYLVGGLCVVAIIGVARSMAFPLPYEGMILMLMFGYFAMGLPFLSASLVSWVLVASYLLVELWTAEPAGDLLINLFFLATANVIGMIGAWTSEYRHRAHFLDRQLLKHLHHAAREESQRKTELITAASHDLRQPLNVIDITLQTLAPGPDSVAGQLRDRVRHLRRLLSTVFDSARLNEGMITAELQPVRLAGL